MPDTPSPEARHAQRLNALTPVSALIEIRNELLDAIDGADETRERDAWLYRLAEKATVALRNARAE